MSRSGYLGALVLLVLNDHVLKQAHPGFVTGKLSDFAGVFLLAVLLAFVMPRIAACVTAGILFTWWKSPLSQTFIDALPWATTRVIDWTDLIALLILPLAYRASRPAPLPRAAHGAVALLSVIAFAATSPSRARVLIPEGHALQDVDTGRTLAELQALEERCGMQMSVQDGQRIVIVSWTRFRFLGSDPSADAWATVETVNGTVHLRFTKIDVVWESEGKDDEYRADLSKRLRRCLGKKR